eukprot:Rhum_TRINITY_DN12396_c0_g3::Rhum_TRINITY_DN12396_c0_g3_i1::g.51510::m.51510
MSLRYDVAVRIRPEATTSGGGTAAAGGHSHHHHQHHGKAGSSSSSSGGGRRCIRVEGRQVVAEKGAFSHAFGVTGPVFHSREEALLAQEEVFRAWKAKSLEVVLSGGLVSLVATGGEASGKSHTLFGAVERQSPQRRVRPGTPREGLRAEGLLPRFAACLLPCTLTFEQLSERGGKCLLTGGIDAAAFPIADVSTLSRLTSRALCTAAPGATLVATLRHPRGGGAALFVEMGDGSGAFGSLVAAAGAEARQQQQQHASQQSEPLYSLDEQLARAGCVEARLAPLLTECNYGVCICCLDPAEHRYTDAIASLRLLDKWKRVPLWPIPPAAAAPAPAPAATPPAVEERHTPSALYATVEVEASPSPPPPTPPRMRSVDGAAAAAAAEAADGVALEAQSREACLLGVVRGLEATVEEERHLRAADARLAADLRRRAEVAEASLADAGVVRDRLAAASRDNDALRAAGERAAEEARRLAARVEELEQQAAYHEGACTRTEEELQKTERRARRGSEVRLSALKENQTLVGLLRQREREVVEEKEEASKLADEAAALRDRAASAEDRLLTAAAEKAQADLQVSQARAELAEVRAANERLKEAPAFYEQEIQRLSKEERAGRILTTKAVTDRKTLQKSIAVLKEAMDKQGKEYYHYKQAMEAQVQEREGEIARERTHLDKMEFECAERLAEMERAKDAEAASAERHALEVSAYQQAAAEMKAQMREVKRAADQTIEALNDSLSKTMLQLQAEAKEAAQLRQVVAKLNLASPVTPPAPAGSRRSSAASTTTPGQHDSPGREESSRDSAPRYYGVTPESEMKSRRLAQLAYGSGGGTTPA